MFTSIHSKCIALSRTMAHITLCVSPPKSPSGEEAGEQESSMVTAVVKTGFGKQCLGKQIGLCEMSCVSGL